MWPVCHHLDLRICRSTSLASHFDSSYQLFAMFKEMFLRLPGSSILFCARSHPSQSQPTGLVADGNILSWDFADRERLAGQAPADTV